MPLDDRAHDREIDARVGMNGDVSEADHSLQALRKRRLELAGGNAFKQSVSILFILFAKNREMHISLRSFAHVFKQQIQIFRSFVKVHI